MNVIFSHLKYLKNFPELDMCLIHRKISIITYFNEIEEYEEYYKLY